jgi:hypothetical protein
LFAYLLGPSASIVEEAYARIADRWQGSASDIAYLPLAPRPAAQYVVKMTIPKTTDGDVPASIDGGQQSLKPESGHLPMFHFRLEDEQAVVSFEVSKVALEAARLRNTQGGPAQHPLSDAVDWRDRPSLLELSAPAKDSKAQVLRPTQRNGAFEFVRLPAISQAPLKVAHTREAQFLSGARRAAEEDLSDLRASGSWEVRKRPETKHACEIYLFELYAHGGELVDRLIAETPLLQGQDPVCSGLSNITAQVRHVYQETPIARFLLHIDS